MVKGRSRGGEVGQRKVCDGAWETREERSWVKVRFSIGRRSWPVSSLWDPASESLIIPCPSFLVHGLQGGTLLVVPAYPAWDKPGNANARKFVNKQTINHAWLYSR